MTGATWAQYLTPTDGHRRLGLVCLGAGVQGGPVLPSRSRVLDCYAMVVVTAGHGWIEVGTRRSYTVHAPALFWLRPGISYSYGPDLGGWAEMWLMFDGPAAAGYLGLGYITPAPDPLAIKDVGPMRRGFSRLAEICRRHGPQLDVEAAISTHQLILAAQLAATDVGKPDEPVLSALRKGAALPLSVQAHAERLGISVSALRDTVRRSAGRGPREYIVQTRLNNAKNLLATSNLSVAAIARRVGYDDPAYFTRLFTHRVGSSPTQFRNQQQRLTTGIDDR